MISIFVVFWLYHTACGSQFPDEGLKLALLQWKLGVLNTHWTAVFLPGESHGQRILAGYSPWGCRESDTTL